MHKKEFILGVMLTLTFFIVLKIIFSPYFGGLNALQAADKLFNSISKGSAYYMKEIQEKVKTVAGVQVSSQVKLPSEKMTQQVEQILSARKIRFERAGDKIKISGDVGIILGFALEDSENMYYNRGDALKSLYNIPEREAMYAWWNFLKAFQKDLMEQKRFKEAKVMQDVITKAVEVGYNFYGIQPESISKKAKIVAFALVFYIIYTIWWGYAIYFLCEGIGFKMKAGKKKEV